MKVNELLKPISPDYIGAYMSSEVQLYHILEWLLKQTGKAKVTVITFSLSEEFIRKVFLLKNAKLIESIDIMLDSKAIQKTEKIVRLAENVFSSVRYTKTHAKIVLVENDLHQFCITGSQNATRGNRQESGIVTNDKKVFSDYKKQIESLVFVENSTFINANAKNIFTIPKKVTQKAKHFNFTNVYEFHNTKGIRYFALFNNNNMDLEHLKSDVNNIAIFVYPVAKYFIENDITKIILAPKGARNTKNGFHFVTELIEQVKMFCPLKVYLPFENVNNVIKKSGVAPDDCYLFDDIITYGTTLKNMDKLQPNLGAIILIDNK